MPDISVNTPSINLEARFTFKEPFNFVLKNKFNVNESSIKLKVISLINMKDMIKNDLRDPFTEIYTSANIDEVEYKKDLLDNVHIVTLSFIDKKDIERYFRVPINYIENISNVSDIEYMNKLILIDLNILPKDLDTSVFFNDIKDFIETRIGIFPEIKEVSIGDIKLLDSVEHETRETIRNNNITVYKTLLTRLEELSLANTELLQRLDDIGISLDLNSKVNT